LLSEVSISYWTRAVLAAVDPLGHPLVHNCDLEAATSQRIGHYRASDARANHEYVRLYICCQTTTREDRRLLVFPDQATGSQIL
jgi:hypothetical protein